MTDACSLVSYRYSVADIDRWPPAVIAVFANHLRTKEEK